MSTPIENAWRRFEAMVVPRTAPDVQRSEMRKAFFGGAATLWQIMNAGLSEGSEPQESDLQMMEALSAELTQFGQELDAALFPSRGQA